jgi:hypothetical protein
MVEEVNEMRKAGWPLGSQGREASRKAGSANRVRGGSPNLARIGDWIRATSRIGWREGLCSFRGHTALLVASLAGAGSGGSDGASPE